MRTRPITDNPHSLAYHIARSVPHERITVSGHVVILHRDDEVMTCAVSRDHTHVTVSSPDGAYATSECTTSDEVSRMWRFNGRSWSWYIGWRGADFEPEVFRSIAHTPGELDLEERNLRGADGPFALLPTDAQIAALRAAMSG